MQSFTPYSALAGGVLIGLSASLLLWFNGRIAGISGIARGLFSGDREAFWWRALFLAGEEVNRCPDTQCQAASPAAFQQRMRDYLLLWRSDGQEAESKWTQILDEVQTVLDRGGILDEPHRRIMMMEIAQRILLPQRLNLLRAGSDQNYPIGARDEA